MKKNFKILDCTIRDGGYYTNWDFDKELIDEYCASMEKLPIEYIEIGYRSIPINGYLGEYFYCPEHVMADLKQRMPSKKLAIILNEKDIRVEHLEELLKPCKSYVSLVRIAVDPKNFKRAIDLAKSIKEKGFKVAFNVMYMSEWKKNSSFLDLLEGLDSVIDYFYMVDSFGGIMPQDVQEITTLVRAKTKVKLGFHGHNNLEMALANTITAIEEGCDIIDCTITGMGRGAGNLRTELFLTYIDRIYSLEINYTSLSNITSSFESLKKEYGWGTNLPYIFSGSYSLPQKQVMEWVGMNRYPMSSLVNALKNQKEDREDNIKLLKFEPNRKYQKAVIIGGGNSAVNHSEAIKKLLNKDKNICLIHAGARNAYPFFKVENDQYYALVGFESEKLLKNIGDISKLSQTCIYPPYPRQMGTVISDEIKKISRELKAIDLLEESKESPLLVALQTAVDLGVKEILLAGFDGYEENMNSVQQILANENQNIFDNLISKTDIELLAVTPTKYKNLEKRSIYNLL